ncbi:M14 family zinc carboxypeptidase [Undibacterium cyanobacteriorum]|uniref:M14 family zinc carboxypeptidase n=1 Tax=Undibacterium cyanobacteriorum TaxID=3073561 RepID=A0ABY9RMY1_9BURK|nr:M14 family zinc carboxypeptidase [Undibacterium sp. 20NA77.5]WMW81777.1 M14 family zinc carboxypeptidase [Undibacterium sp. 20NA77.5]
MTNVDRSAYPTPYELGNQNQTTTLADCIAYYQTLAADFPQVLRLFQIGVSDAGVAMYAGVITADGVFDRAQLKAAGRPVFFNNNGIHPGEPEGIDSCMALVRDFCVDEKRRAALGKTVFLFIPVYNVDGSLNRQNTSRVNQEGPEMFGFRANSRNLDLNRDFIKCDSLAAAVFNRFFTEWDPDVMVDTHTSNGADYSYTMTLIQTQADKLGDDLGPFLRNTMLPEIYAKMEQRGWPTCPYVNPVKVTPDDGIEDFLEVPRFSTGFAALHHTIGFMPETHMLKPYGDRYDSMRALVEVVLDFTIANASHIQDLRAQARAATRARTAWPVTWRADHTRPSSFRFKGYEAVYSPSKIGNYQRLSYDRSKPWEKDITYYDHFVADIVVQTPKAYLIPQAWREAIERLRWNGVELTVLAHDQQFTVQSYLVKAVKSRANPYEGHMFHDQVELEKRDEVVQARAGDILVYLDQANARYAVETLEPQAHDSFFRWGFFNSVLEKKEAYSDYVFEDSAYEMLQSEPELAAKFEAWKAAHPELLSDQTAVLDFIFANGQRFHEPEWRRYPVFAVLAS